MVKLHVKRNDKSLFLYEVTTDACLSDVIDEITSIHNGKLKVERICHEIEDLVKYGAILPVGIQGLNKEQVDEQQLVDEWFVKLKIDSSADDFVVNEDPLGRRNSKAPSKKLAEILTKSIAEAKSTISDASVKADQCLTLETVYDTLDMLRGALNVVYPNGLPFHDPIRCELENREDLKNTQAEKSVVDISLAELWWAGKQLLPTKKLKDYVGTNEKTKIIVKLQKRGAGPPSREPQMSEEERKMMMMESFRKQEELKRLDDDDDDRYLESEWADRQNLKKSFHGVQNISWRP